MGKKINQTPPSTAKEAREVRLKAALKANLQRRKAQTRARDQTEDDSKNTRPKGGNDKAG